MTDERIERFGEIRERAVSEEALSSDVYDFYLKLFRIQAEEVSSLRQNLSSADKIRFQGADFPMSDAFSPGESAYPSLMEALEATAAAAASHQKNIDLSEIIAFFKTDPPALDEQFRNIIKRDFEAVTVFAESRKVLSESLIFILVSVLRPLLYVMRTGDTGNFVEHDENSDIPDHECPFCGYSAGFATIHDGEDNKLYLHCGLCENRWLYRRLSCAVCGSDDKDKLTYYTSEINAIHRIDCCDSCGGYIKMFRVSKGTDIDENDLCIEDLISGYLDATAMDMGFRRP